MFLGYEKVETVEKPKTAELTEEQQAWLEQERRNNQAAVAAALATPTGRGASRSGHTRPGWNACDVDSGLFAHVAAECISAATAA